MIDTVVSAKPRDGKRPGFVTFSAAGEISTFVDSALEVAAKSIGQRVEYAIEERQSNGKTYRNLVTVKPVTVAGGDSGASSSSAAIARDMAPAIAQLKRIADGIDRLIALAAAPKPKAAASAPAAAETSTPAESGDTDGDSVPAMQERFANKVGSDAAKAMVAAIEMKHKKNEAGVKAELAKLLAAHGVE